MVYTLDLRRNGSPIFFGRPRWFVGGKEIFPPFYLESPSCILVHGYNVSNADKAYEEIIESTKHMYKDFVKVLWPGSEIVLAFWLASMRAKSAGKILARELSSRAHTIDASGHSLGAKVLLEARGLYFRNLILAGPAVDNEALNVDGPYADVRAEIIAVFYSRNDPVLGAAYRLAKLDNALGHSGPESMDSIPLNVRVYDLSDVVKGHSSYKDVVKFYRAWEELCQSER